MQIKRQELLQKLQQDRKMLAQRIKYGVTQFDAVKLKLDIEVGVLIKPPPLTVTLQNLYSFAP